MSSVPEFEAEPAMLSVSAWLAEPYIWKLAPLALVSPPKDTSVAAPKVALFGPICTVRALARVPPMVREPPPSPPPISRSSTPLLVKPLVTDSSAVPASPTVPVALLVKALLRLSAVSVSPKAPLLLVNPALPRCSVSAWLAEPYIWKLAPLALVSPPKDTSVAAPKVALFGPICTVRALARVPPMVREPPPSPPPISRSSTPLLVKPPVTDSSAVPASPTVPVALLVKALLRLSAVSVSPKAPLLLVNPALPRCSVSAWLAEPYIWKLAPLALVSPPKDTSVAAPKVALFGPICTVRALARVPPMVREPPPSPPPISRSSTPLLVKPPVTDSAAVPASPTVPVALLVKALLRLSAVSVSPKAPLLLVNPALPRCSVSAWLAEPYIWKLAPLA